MACPARMMAQGTDGTVFIGTRNIGRVYAVTDAGEQRTIRTVAERLNEPNGVAVRDGSLDVIAINRVLRYDGLGARMGEVPQPTDLTAAFAFRPKPITAGSSPPSGRMAAST